MYHQKEVANKTSSFLSDASGELRLEDDPAGDAVEADTSAKKSPVEAVLKKRQYRRSNVGSKSGMPKSKEFIEDSSDTSSLSNSNSQERSPTSSSSRDTAVSKGLKIGSPELSCGALNKSRESTTKLSAYIIDPSERVVDEENGSWHQCHECFMRFLTKDLLDEHSVKHTGKYFVI